MITVSGSKSIHKKIWFYLKNLYIPSGKIVVIDAANKFDPYIISKISLSKGISPYIVLENIVIARSFTPFQLLKLLEKVKNFQDFPLVCLGINYLFEDENIPYASSWKIFKKCISIIKNYKNISILTANTEISFRNFISFLKNESIVFVEEEKVVKPVGIQGEKLLWAGQLHHLLQY